MNDSLKKSDVFTIGEVSARLSMCLAEELCLLEILDKSDGLLSIEHLHFTPKKRFLLTIKDCIAACFLLKSKGLLLIDAPHYDKGGFFAKMTDHWGNLYLIKEERSYQFDLSI